MKIEGLGTACMKRNKLYNEAQNVAAESGVQGELSTVQKITDIAAYGVAITHALVIDGEAKPTLRRPRSKPQVSRTAYLPGFPDTRMSAASPATQSSKPKSFEKRWRGRPAGRERLWCRGVRELTQ